MKIGRGLLQTTAATETKGVKASRMEKRHSLVKKDTIVELGDNEALLHRISQLPIHSLNIRHIRLQLLHQLALLAQHL